MIVRPQQQQLVTVVATGTDGRRTDHLLRDDEGVFVGRSSNCGLKLPDAGIADIHCRIDRSADQLWIQDWMSNGGTRVNGAPIWTKVQIRQGDLIQIGSHTIGVRWQDPSGSAPQPSESKAIDTEDPVEVDCDVHGSNDLPTGAGDEETWFDLDVDFDDPELIDGGDRETIAVLQAEIDHLRTELAQRDAERHCESAASDRSADDDGDPPDHLLDRLQQLIDEANRSDERAALLEEMLHAADDANRAEQEERQHLAGWVGDIEQRVALREEEHHAEIKLIRKRLAESHGQQNKLQQRLQAAAEDGSAAQHHEETLAQLQQQNQELQENLAEVRKSNQSLQHRIEQLGSQHEQGMREERANLAKEQAKVSRLRYELTAKLSAIEELPKSENQTDQETARRIQTLREHLREIHEQEKQEEREVPLTRRLAKLWTRVEA